MTDAPIPADTPLPQPPSPLETLKGLLGDLARPYVLIATGTATAKVIWVEADAAVITAAGALVAILYGAKELGNWGQAKETTKVEVAKVAATTGATTP